MEALTLLDGPLGICLPHGGTYRITAQVGAGDVPAPVSEAFRRLAEYSAEIGDTGMVGGAPVAHLAFGRDRRRHKGNL